MELVRLPTVHTAAYVVTQLVGFLCAGLVAGLVLKKQQFTA
ncbi:MAG: hypothetical protein ACR2II_11910 [Chthoniobacterales bacterium]